MLLLKILIKIFFIKEEYQIPFIHFEFFFNQKLFTFLILALSEYSLLFLILAHYMIY